MRTTLTIDDDLARELKETAHRERRPFRDVVNDALRRGIGQGATAPAERFTVEPLHLGFAPGVDPRRLNQLADDLEAAEFVAESARDRS